MIGVLKEDTEYRTQTHKKCKAYEKLYNESINDKTDTQITTSHLHRYEMSVVIQKLIQKFYYMSCIQTDVH